MNYVAEAVADYISSNLREDHFIAGDLLADEPYFSIRRSGPCRISSEQWCESIHLDGTLLIIDGHSNSSTRPFGYIEDDIVIDLNDPTSFEQINHALHKYFK